MTLGVWTTWLLLVILLCLQVYIGTVNELQVPRFLLRAIEDHLAQSGVTVTFGRATFDPTGRILLQKARFRLASFTEPVATADAIAGPWTASSEPLVAPGDGSIPGPGDANSGRIDASLLREPTSGDLYHDPNTNNLYLYYIYQPRWVHVTQLTSDGLSLVKGADRELQLTSGGAFTATLAWEKTTIEGVEAHYVDGQFVLLYSGAGTWDGTYAVGAARSSSPEGPFTKHGNPILQTKPGGSLVGPGHSSQWVRGPDGSDYLLYHTQFRDLEGSGGPRVLDLSKLTFDADGWPVVGDGYPTEAPLSVP